MSLDVTMESDSAVKILVMANASNSKAQVDATHASKLYSAGRLESFRHVYEAYCNLRLYLNLMVADADASLLGQKLGEYVDLLDGERASTLFESSPHRMYMPIHAYQDLQHIFTAFLLVACDSTLINAVIDDGDITLASYQSAIDVADSLTTNLRSILYGNGEGTFKERPMCADWFLGATTKPAPERIRGAGTAPGATAATAQKKQKTASPPDVARLKTLGVLAYNSSVEGATLDWIDRCPVKAKKKGGKTPERLCMKYLTQGFACEGTCRKPHVPNLSALTEGDRKKLVDYVGKCKGLSWLPGKEPAGAS